MNTEKMVIVKACGAMYVNTNLGFHGSINQAKEYAKNHNFGGGVEIYNPRTRKFKKA
jgi:hypothetical protein